MENRNATDKEQRVQFKDIAEKLHRLMAEEKLNNGRDYTLTGALENGAYHVHISIFPKTRSSA